MTALQSAREQKDMLSSELRNWEFMKQTANNTMFELEFRNKRMYDLNETPDSALRSRIISLHCHVAVCEDTIYEYKTALLDIEERILELIR